MSRALVRRFIDIRPMPCSSNFSVNLGLTHRPTSFRGLFSRIQTLNNSTTREDLGQTLILLEDGSNIRELPVIVRKVSSNSVIFCENKVVGVKSVATNFKENNSDELENRPNSFDKRDQLEIVEQFNKCFTARGVFSILETLPSSEVTPHIALQALKKIVTLENNKVLRNTPFREDENADDVQQFEDGLGLGLDLHPNETFTRTAVLNQLVDKILSSSDSDVLLSGFLIINRDLVGKFVSKDHMERFSNEVLCRVTDGKFAIKQTCEAIKIFCDIGKKPNDNVDKLWVGITEKAHEVTKDNIGLMDVFRCIPYLYKSKKVILAVVEKRIQDLWWNIEGRDVAEILVILKQIKSNSPKMLAILAHWVNKNIHLASEDDLLEIINGFCSLDYSSGEIEHALERYVKAKGVAVKNPNLIANIMDYCYKFHVRSPHLLQGAAEYLIVHGRNLSSVLLQRLFTPLGHLTYFPSNGLQFWQVLEMALEEKFVQFRPEEAIDMLLHCIYLEKYPLNFVKKVFNPYFLDRLHSYKNKELLSLSRLKLQILDTAMTLECEQYPGPLLPRAHAVAPTWRDGRIRRMMNNISYVWNDIAGGIDKVYFHMVPSQLPSIDIYIIDALVYYRQFNLSMWPINLDRDRDLHTAVLIHLPEHYCTDGQHLIGPQVMRKRHLRHIGFKVVGLNYNELAKLRVHPPELQRYIKKQFSLSEPSFPKVKPL